MNGDALVGNASSRKQLDEAGKKEKQRDFMERDDFRKLADLPEFRRFIWRMLGRTKVFESVWSPNAQIHYNAGQQDVGHILMGMFEEFAPEHFHLMMKENGNAS